MAILSLAALRIGASPVSALYRGSTLLASNDPAGIYDTFDTADATKWTGYDTPGAAMTVAGGDAVILTRTNYYTLRSTARWDFSAGSITTRIAQLPSVGNGTVSTKMQIAASSTNKLSFGIAGNQFRLEQIANGQRASPDLSAAVNLTHKVLRARRDGAGVIFETSADGSTWETRFTLTTSPIALTSVAVELNTGHYGTESNPGSARFSYVTTSATLIAAPPP